MSTIRTQVGGLGRADPIFFPLTTCCVSLCSLMEACFHGHVECAELLVKHGSSCLTRDYSGFSSLHYAVDGGHIDMVNFVLNEQVPVKKP